MAILAISVAFRCINCSMTVYLLKPSASDVD